MQSICAARCVLQAVASGGTWQPELPHKAKLREPGAVHEASCLWFGDHPCSSVVGPDYRPWGVQNVYVTGGSLFPSAGESPICSPK